MLSTLNSLNTYTRLCYFSIKCVLFSRETAWTELHWAVCYGLHPAVTAAALVDFILISLPSLYSLSTHAFPRNLPDMPFHTCPPDALRLPHHSPTYNLFMFPIHLHLLTHLPLIISSVSPPPCQLFAFGSVSSCQCCTFEFEPYVRVPDFLPGATFCFAPLPTLLLLDLFASLDSAFSCLTIGC